MLESLGPRPALESEGCLMRKTMVGAWIAVLLAADTGAVSAQDVYVYPARNQTDEQMTRDKEECHDWAVKQTGVDPEKVAAAVVAPPASGQSSSGAGSGARRCARGHVRR